jgi:DnaJ-class molecular chaperone
MSDLGECFVDEWETCPECGGDGEVLLMPQHDDPEYCFVRQCFTCGGSGWICA